jgi:hypothetical protein
LVLLAAGGSGLWAGRPLQLLLLLLPWMLWLLWLLWSVRLTALLLLLVLSRLCWGCCWSATTLLCVCMLL